MTSLDDEPRNFDDLDAHGVQEALREELSDDISKPDQPGDVDDELLEGQTRVTDTEITEEEQQDVHVSEDAAGDSSLDEDVSDEDEGQESPEIKAVWTAAQMADHARMAEALLFAAVEPLDEASIAERLPIGADIPEIMQALQAQYENRGVNLSKISKKWRFVTAADVSHVLEKERVEPRKLSRAALETLAIIAYHQPCTRADIEDVRGVAVSKGSLDQLIEIGWVRLRGRRKDVPGRPVLYGTNQSFLEHFGLESLTDLPGMADLKAAGLLDARLPPGFSIPSPSDAEEASDASMEEDDAEFAQDFLGEEDEDAVAESQNDEFVDESVDEASENMG